MKILYVDSDSTYSKKCLNDLIEHGYDVKLAASIHDAVVEFSYRKPEIVIFDYQLADGTGTSLLDKLGEVNSKCKKILFCDNVSEKIMVDVITHKVDGYVPKRDTFKALNVQIKALCDTVEKTHNLFNLGQGFTYERDTFHIKHENEEIPLTTQECKVVNELLDATGEYLSYEHLQNSVGRDEYTTIDTLRTVIKKIRQKTYSNMIENKSGFGYKIHYNNSLEAPLFLENCFHFESNHFSNINLLIVEGKKELSNHIAYELSNCGFNCENVYTEAQAKELLKKYVFDYVLTNIDLPDGDGIHLIRETEGQGIKFIVLSNASDIHYKECLYFNGILDYIIWNSQLEYLVKSVCNTIQRVERNTCDNHILVVESSKRVYQQITDLLMPRNYKLSFLNDPDLLPVTVQRNNIDLVVLSRELDPTFDLTRKIKNGVKSFLPVIVLGEQQRSYEETKEAYMCGANEYLRKPIFHEEFILKVDQLMDQGKVISELERQNNLFKPYQMVVDQTTCFFKTDTDRAIIDVNERFLMLSGYSREDLIGQDFSILRHPDISQTLYDEIWRTVKEEKKVWDGVIKNINKSGKGCMVKTFVMPVHSSSGDMIETIILQIEINKI